MTKEEVIQTLIDDYSRQAKLSKRERTIFKHGLLTGIEIGPIEEPEVDLEKEIELIKGDYEQVEVAWNNDFDFIARHFYELGLNVNKGK